MYFRRPVAARRPVYNNILDSFLPDEEEKCILRKPEKFYFNPKIIFYNSDASLSNEEASLWIGNNVRIYFQLNYKLEGAIVSIIPEPVAVRMIDTVIESDLQKGIKSSFLS